MTRGLAIVLWFAASAHAETVATLSVESCHVVGVIGDDVIIDAGKAGAFVVPRSGGSAQNIHTPGDNARWDYRVHGSQIIYRREEPQDNGTWRLEYLGMLDRATKQTTELVAPNKIWAVTADDKFLYYADVGPSFGDDEGSEIFKVPLAGGDKTTVSVVPGRVQELRAHRGTLFAATETSKPGRSNGAKFSCHEIHRASAKRSKRLDRIKCPERGELGGLTVTPNGIYYVRADAVRRLPLAGGKETVLAEADVAHHMPAATGTTFAWQHEKVFFVADAAKQKLIPKQLPLPGEWHRSYVFSGDDVFWAESETKQCKILRATAR